MIERSTGTFFTLQTFRSHYSPIMHFDGKWSFPAYYSSCKCLCLTWTSEDSFLLRGARRVWKRKELMLLKEKLQSPAVKKGSLCKVGQYFPWLSSMGRKCFVNFVGKRRWRVTNNIYGQSISLEMFSNMAKTCANVGSLKNVVELRYSSTWKHIFLGYQKDLSA